MNAAIGFTLKLKPNEVALAAVYQPYCDPDFQASVTTDNDPETIEALLKRLPIRL